MVSYCLSTLNKKDLLWGLAIVLYVSEVAQYRGNISKDGWCLTHTFKPINITQFLNWNEMLLLDCYFSCRIGRVRVNNTISTLLGLITLSDILCVRLSNIIMILTSDEILRAVCCSRKLVAWNYGDCDMTWAQHKRCWIGTGCDELMSGSAR